MAYKFSKTDNDNIGWFKKDNSKATLLGIQLTEGKLRGLNHFTVHFEYPISIFSGKNCSGKSTMLALASCAYHNDSEGIKQSGRKNTYYTFSDFFIQSREEIPPQGIQIRYKFLHNNWRPSKKRPDGKGIGIQARTKRTGGKWNDYSQRVSRNVVFLGIERVVPYAEKAVYKNYRSYFKKDKTLGWEVKVKDTVGKILGKQYDDFWFINHGKYRVPVVKVNGHIYSGFNMGAGEHTLFELFSIVFGCPKGVLIVIDEIELGLHDEALKRFITELKEICLTQKFQIIATTHSQTVLQNIPPIGRFFIETIGNDTIVTDSITAMFASGKLSGENSNELDIYVEDGIAKKLLELALNNEVRNRVNIISIGSSSAISRQLAARYKNIKNGDCIAVLDGDKKQKYHETRSAFLNALESVKEQDQDEVENWLNARIEYLPGDTWPESWILNEIKNNENKFLSELLNIGQSRLLEITEEAILSGKHNEFYTLADKLNLDRNFVISICAKGAITQNSDRLNLLEKFIEDRLSVS